MANEKFNCLVCGQSEAYPRGGATLCVMLAALVLFPFASSLAFAQPDNLDLGVPGKADQIVNRDGYALGYCEAWEQPRWVTYRLTADLHIP